MEKINTNRNYRKLFSELVEVPGFIKYGLEQAHQYALKGRLYDSSNSETKSFLDQLATIDEEINKLEQEKFRMNMEKHYEIYIPRKRELQKQRKDVLELLIAGVETTPKEELKTQEEHERAHGK